MLTDEAKWFTEMFSELKDCNEEEQKQKIKEMNENVDGMNKEKFRSIFTKELFNKIDEMIEVKKLTMGNVLLLMKHIGFINGTKICLLHSFKESSLNKRFEKMIVIENIKKEEKNENFLANLCKFYLLLNDGIISTEMVSIIMPCLLKAASKKERNEETQKEVEIAFLALSHIDRYYFLRQELYLKEIKEIIQNHQEHYNLSRIGYQSAWKFLINRLFCDEDLERLIVNERHFVTEAAKELEELSKCVDWKKKKEEMSREEMKEANISKRWIRTLGFFIESCTLWNDEFIELIRSIIQVLRAAKENHGEISELCIYFLRSAAENRVVKIEDLLESEAVDAVLEEVTQLHVVNEQTSDYLHFFKILCERLNSKREIESDEAKINELKRKAHEKLEEEGYEDCIIGLRCCMNEVEFSSYFLVENIDDYFIYC